MEAACTEHLKEIGGYLKPEFKQIEFSAGNFEYEASVIIPVRNRIRTIRDAIRSVLDQKTDFKFNLIIIDNHSTDGTTEAIDEYKNDERLIHIIPRTQRPRHRRLLEHGRTPPQMRQVCRTIGQRRCICRMKIHWPLWYVLSTNRTAHGSRYLHDDGLQHEHDCSGHHRSQGVDTGQRT